MIHCQESPTSILIRTSKQSQTAIKRTVKTCQLWQKGRDLIDVNVKQRCNISLRVNLYCEGPDHVHMPDTHLAVLVQTVVLSEPPSDCVIA